jgi:TolB-like protein/DNA-binding winged helix-turn-helix (wHTH) protein
MNIQSGRTLTVNGITADFGSETLWDKSGASVDLRPQAFAVLRHLAEHSDRLVTKEELMQSVWPGIAVTDDSLVQCVHEIRRAFLDDGHTILKTVPKRGYRFTAPSEASKDPAAWRPRLSRVYPVIVVAALLIVSGASLWWVGRNPQGAELSVVAKPAVAVLPFRDLSGDEGTGPLAKGLTEDIITDLARFPEFQVIARNSTQPYEGKAADPIAVGKALHVAFVVDGSIQRQGDRVRITAQLADAKTGRSLWSDRWDRPDTDLFAIQTEISEYLANRLGGGGGLIQEAGRIAARRKPPENLNAYELYLLGTERLEQMNRKDVEEAIRLLNRAVEIDPGLARAWVELYHAHTVMVDFGAERDENRRLATEAAARAVRLDPSDPEAHVVFGMSIADQRDFVRAKAEFDTALRLAPNQFEILCFYILYASPFGEPERGIKMVDQAIALNPNFPIWSTRMFAYAYFMAGRYPDVLRMIDRLGSDNYGQWMWVYRSGALAALNRKEEARQSVTKALQAFPKLTIEAHVSEPDYNDVERRRLIDTMRLAGFPACAKPDQLAKIAKPVRLPECTVQP